MTTPTTPQDNKPKADTAFTFKGADGKTYKLPAPNENAAELVPGEITHDAIMSPDNEMAQLRLGFATLDACKPTPAAMKALRSLSTKAMIEVLGEWMGGPSGSSD